MVLVLWRVLLVVEECMVSYVQLTVSFELALSFVLAGIAGGWKMVLWMTQGFPVSRVLLTLSFCCAS